MDVELDALLELREEANAGAPKKDGEAAYKLSVNDFVIKALALALQRVPAANAVWAGDRILRFKHSDVGVAVAIDGGLITPVIRNAEQKSLSAISNEMKELAARARDKKLKPAEYQGGASAISNLGMYGVREFSAIINPPHATILAVGAAQRRPVETADGGVKFVSQMTVTLSCDHRVVDGALGAELLAAFKQLIEARCGCWSDDQRFSRNASSIAAMARSSFGSASTSLSSSTMASALNTRGQSNAPRTNDRSVPCGEYTITASIVAQ